MNDKARSITTAIVYGSFTLVTVALMIRLGYINGILIMLLVLVGIQLDHIMDYWIGMR